MSNKRNFKIVLLGEGRVGKTSLTLRFIKDVFDEHQQSTIQATYLQKDLKVGDQNVCLSVWDTAGQERFHALGPIYYRNADGALLVYDITDQDTFERAKTWVMELRKVLGDDIIITIAGNKCDMIKQRQVSEEQALEYARSVGANHLLTSAKANKNVAESFLDLTKRILEKKAQGGNVPPSSNRMSTRGVSGLTIEDTSRPSSHSRINSRVSGLTITDDTPQKKQQDNGPCCK
ncbi:hypothetical protein C9374_011415 [Naegleria lovaniensis]|uniref:Ras-related protein Rab-21 n=1 Tax=Naegleria lovaniensis TaxID=51637 RepID=A0AA88GXB6_NAELO|nr:uncharacterized protein C9374_011415 [Naegleria lovaniensis]KAG2392690.1 hypothetical protein C9374_011415 [Naegleria lovaniensis]